MNWMKLVKRYKPSVSYKIYKYRGYKVEHGDSHYQYRRIMCLKVAERINLKSSHHREKFVLQLHEVMDVH